MLAAGLAIVMLAVVVGLLAGGPSAFTAAPVEMAQADGGGEPGEGAERERDRLREDVAGPASGADEGEMAAAAAARVEQLAYPRGYVTSRAALRSAAATSAVPASDSLLG